MSESVPMAHVDNIGSNRTLQKAGFVKEGMMRKRFYIEDQAQDGNMYSLIKEDYEIKELR